MSDVQQQQDTMFHDPVTESSLEHKETRPVNESHETHTQMKNIGVSVQAPSQPDKVSVLNNQNRQETVNVDVDSRLQSPTTPFLSPEKQSHQDDKVNSHNQQTPTVTAENKKPYSHQQVSQNGEVLINKLNEKIDTKEDILNQANYTVQDANAKRKENAKEEYNIWRSAKKSQKSEIVTRKENKQGDTEWMEIMDPIKQDIIRSWNHGNINMDDYLDKQNNIKQTESQQLKTNEQHKQQINQTQQTSQPQQTGRSQFQQPETQQHQPQQTSQPQLHQPSHQQYISKPAQSQSQQQVHPSPTKPPSIISNQTQRVSWSKRQQSKQDVNFDPQPPIDSTDIQSPTSTDEFGFSDTSFPSLPSQTTKISQDSSIMEQLPQYKQLLPYAFPIFIGIVLMVILFMYCCIRRWIHRKSLQQFSLEAQAPQDLDMVELQTTSNTNDLKD